MGHNHFINLKSGGGDCSLYIKRLQVEAEGFLSNVEIEFKPGLNVIIGARGTGKTSVIELVRYCLGADGFTDDAVARGTQQARAILQGAAVSVELDGSDGPHTFSRSSAGQIVGTSATIPTCTVLAQNEVEAVGAQASGRIHLIDRYRASRLTKALEIERLGADLMSLTAQLQTLLAEGSDLTQQVQQAATVQSDLAAARAAQQSLLAQAKASDADRTKLSQLELSSNRLAARTEFINASVGELELMRIRLDDHIQSTLSTLAFGQAPEGADLAAAQKHVSRGIDHLRLSIEELEQASSKLREASLDDSMTRNAIDAESRQLRQRLDAVQSGISNSSRRVQDLEERLGQLSALTQRLDERRARYADVRSRRDAAYERVDALRDEVFSERSSVAAAINESLGPLIRATVLRSARLGAYEAAIVSALRGSGIHYNSLAPAAARAASPFELVKWAEEARVDDLARALDITSDRAAAVVAALRGGGTAEIIASDIQDDVVLELLDGHDYKPTDRLSIGQRCTVILPVLLGQHGDPLLVDQPEDHLDNAFIAEALVSAINKRSPEDQIIFTSHNANIPVLGNADQVIVMDSDGERAFVALAGPLDDPQIVEAISRIMEGGKEAFETRARFYGEPHQPH